MTLTLPPAELDSDPAPADPELDATPAPVGVICGSALLATAAFGWSAGSIFSGLLPRAVGLAGSLLGILVVLLSTRSRRPSLVQYAGAAVAVVAGALLVVPFTRAGTDLPSLVVDAIRSGGLGQPPVAFDPGWRFLLLIAVALLAQTSAGLALAYARPRLAAAVTVPFVVGASLLQPPNGALTGTVVALLLLVASLGVSIGADQIGDGTSRAGFELRRLARGAAALVVLGALLSGAARIGVLFPPPAASAVIPPMRPPTPPPARDRVLFTVTADRPTTWRLGTLDVYRGTAWLTPPYDASALLPVNGPIPATAKDTRGPVPIIGTSTVHYRLGDYGSKALPGAADPVAVRAVSGAASGIGYDPRTQALRSLGTAFRPGAAYDVVVPPQPTGAALASAGPAPATVTPFLAAPPPPAAVSALLTLAPRQSFARLQYVRRQYFARVVAAGGGVPVDVPPARVADMLQGKPATPYEITAGEALLARWAGVPARIGYGWYGGDRTPDGRALQIRPRNGATWLEAYFQGSGWVPIIGTPPRAKSSLRPGQRNTDPSVRPTDQLALVVYAPIRLRSFRLAYVVVRYYAVRAVPIAALVLALLVFSPGLRKAVRRVRRRRHARRLGPAGRIAAAYAEVRDLATDLNIGDSGLSPLELLDRFEDDPEHRELAWLVTRALWGDLRRDLQPADVEAAEEMSRSVARRIRQAQPAFARMAALASRSSLADPWTRELTIPWVPGRRRTALVAGIVVLVAAAASASAAVLSQPAGRRLPAVAVHLPDPLAPAAVGDVRLVREAGAEQGLRGSIAAAGRVFSLRQGDVVQGSLQVTALAADLDTRAPRVRDQILAGFSGGRFRPARIGEDRIYRLDLPEQTLLLAFTPDGHSFYLLVVRSAYSGADALFAAVLAYARGQSGTAVPVTVPVPDPRRGSSQ